MHFCGDWFHDIFVNAFVLVAFYPEWLPFGAVITGWAKRKIAIFNQEENHKHE